MSGGAGSLLPPPAGELTAGLAALEKDLARHCPIPSRHRKSLPGSVRRLHELLTGDRADLPRDYLSQKPLLSAYLYWFLPRNLLRQGRLLQGLGLDVPDGARVLDLGAGPLTFFQALWLACPQMRERKLDLTAVDRSEAVLRNGSDLLTAMQQRTSQSGWTTRTVRSLAGRVRSKEPADLLVAANLLNELDQDQRRGARTRGSGATLSDHVLDEWERLIDADGLVLVIEPGTRPASRRLVRLREAALQRGWQVAAPCTHDRDCVAPGRAGGPWCHFLFSGSRSVPWLDRLGRAADLSAERLSLSFLLLARSATPTVKLAGSRPPRRGEVAVRVISETFDLPDRRHGCYGCSPRGLLLLTADDRSAMPVPGDGLTCTVPEDARRDAKSSALIVPRAADRHDSGVKPGGKSGGRSGGKPAGKPNDRKRR